MSDLLAWMDALPEPAIYLLLGIGAALENVLPAIPADTFVALGGLLAAVGTLGAGWVFLCTWICNVASALVMYRLGYRHGRTLFSTPVGRQFLKPHQLERMGRFYERWGLPAIFLTRFLPGFRAIVPVFAGISRLGWLSVAFPLILASAIWYGALVRLGMWAGTNIELLGGWLERLQGTLGAVAIAVAIGVTIWWWRSRHPSRD